MLDLSHKSTLGRAVTKSPSIHSSLVMDFSPEFQVRTTTECGEEGLPVSSAILKPNNLLNDFSCCLYP